MTDHLAWYVARSTGIVAFGLLLASMLWGLLHATRALGHRARTWWMLGVHRFLGALAVVFVVVHVLAVVADGYTSFGPADVLVPFASAWRPLPVAIGIVAWYVLLAVEVTSLLRRHLSANAWRQIHLASYGAFALVTLHALTAGTDVRSMLVGGSAVAIGIVAVLLSALAWIARSAPRTPRVSRVSPGAPDPVGERGSVPSTR